MRDEGNKGTADAEAVACALAIDAAEATGKTTFTLTPALLTTARRALRSLEKKGLIRALVQKGPKGVRWYMLPERFKEYRQHDLTNFGLHAYTPRARSLEKH